MQSLVNELTEQALSQTLPQAIRTLVGAVGRPIARSHACIRYWSRKCHGKHRPCPPNCA